MTITPPFLKKGDSIGIVCPSGFMDFEKAGECIQILTEIWGFKVKVGKTLGGSSENYFSGTDKDRLSDLQKMLDDEEIKAILCARGGYGLSRIIDNLQFKKFLKRPKWIIGFSDITLLHNHVFGNFHVATLHAPMAAAFNKGATGAKYIKYLKNTLEGKPASYACKPHALNTIGSVTGELVGGNLSLLVNSIGTASEIKTAKRILFIEDIGEYIYSIDRMMQQLKRAGKFSKIKGVIIGGFADIKDTERPFGQSAYEAIDEALREYDCPKCYAFPISHETENITVKIGGKYHLKIGKQKVLLNEVP